MWWKNFKFWLSYHINYPLVAPDMLQLCFTFRCNLRCRMCSMEERMNYLRAENRPYKLSISLMKELISQAHKIGIREVYLVGGEPFMEPKIFDIVRYAHNLGMRTVINTNGVLVKGEKIEEIFSSGLSCLTFSIDGPDKESYGRIRGEDVFEDVISNLSSLLAERSKRKEIALQVTILCTIMRQNLTKLPQMVKFASDLGVDNIAFQPVVPDNTDQARWIESDTWVKPEEYEILDKIIDELISLKMTGFQNFITSSIKQLKLMKLYFRSLIPKRRRKCYLGFSRLIVTQDHRLYFCAPDPKSGEVSFGDVSQQSLKELWYSSRARQFRKYIKNCQRPCLLFCSYRLVFDEIFDKLYSFLNKFNFRR